MAKKKEQAVEENIAENVVDSNSETAAKEITIRKSITFTEMVEFIDSVVQACFVGSNGEYSPEARHIATHVNLVKRYTNMELPDDTDDIYRTIHETGVVWTILEHIDKEQYDEIEYAIGEKVRYLNMVHTNEMISSMRRIYEQLKEVSDAVSDIFADVRKEDLESLLKNLSESGISKEDIVKAVLNARSTE